MLSVGKNMTAKNYVRKLIKQNLSLKEIQYTCSLYGTNELQI